MIDWEELILIRQEEAEEDYDYDEDIEEYYYSQKELKYVRAGKQNG